MPSLTNPDQRAAILERLRQVSPNGQPQWGTLTAPRMICHLADQLRVALEQIPCKDRSTLFRRTLLKWVVLYTPFQPPPGKVKTSREMLTSSPSTWASDMAACEALIEEVAAGRAHGMHPAFGPMGPREWAIMAWKHMDHHLRQFGV